MTDTDSSMTADRRSAPEPETGAQPAITEGILSGPTVSVVCPAYNAADRIERTLAGARAQTYRAIVEVIVVDDGSQDGTAEVVRRCCPEVRLIVQQNTGSCIARNNGVEAAGGEYVALLDDDDEWFPEKTAVQMEAFARNPELQLTIGDAISILNGKVIRGSRSETHLVDRLDFPDVFPTIDFHYGCSGWVIERRTFLESRGFDPALTRNHDAELLWRLILADHPTARVTGALYSYFPGYLIKTSSPVPLFEDYYRNVVPVAEDYARRAANTFGAQWAQDAIADFHWHRGWVLLQHGAHEMGRKALAEGARRSRGRLRRLTRRLGTWYPPLYRAISRVCRRSRDV